MQSKPVFLLTAIVGLFFGISLMLFPEMILDLVEATYLNGGPAMARHAASWILAASVFALFIRDLEHSEIRQAIFVMFDVAFLLMIIAELYSYITGVANVMILTIVALHVLFVLLYTYLFIENR
ncbi:MAG: hypothetical protein ACXABV_14385 [Candidatus Thorarchaeota archaeon]